jgi:hypothetical protein
MTEDFVSNNVRQRRKYLGSIKDLLCNKCGFWFKPKKKSDTKKVCYECRILDYNDVLEGK